MYSVPIELNYMYYPAAYTTVASNDAQPTNQEYHVTLQDNTI